MYEVFQISDLQSQSRLILLPQKTWKCLETFLVTNDQSWGQGGAIGISWVEARDAAQHIGQHRLPQRRITQSKMSIMPRLQNPTAKEKI